MRKLDCVKADPCGNTTVFVLDPVEKKDYGSVARAIMSEAGIGAEQVGFIVKRESGYRMEMMGGEFCGNASRSFAAWLTAGWLTAAWLTAGWLTAGCSSAIDEAATVPKEGVELQLDVSGADGLLRALVLPSYAPNRRYVSCDMPLPKRVVKGEDGALGAYTLVVFEGICHIVLWAHGVSEGDIESAAGLISALGFDASVFGILYREGEDGMRPLVHVGAAGTTVWETSCGSGSCAFAAARALETGRSGEYIVKQPGGELAVRVELDGNAVTRLVLGGDIALTAFSRVYIDDPDMIGQ